MGKLNIAHHKSYHPYRRDNIERVRQDEEAARLKEAGEEGRMRIADSEARLDLLRGRSGGSKRLKHKDDDVPARQPVVEITTISTSSGHINLFSDIEQHAMSTAMTRSRELAVKAAKTEDEKGVRLAPSTKDLNPWYSDRNSGEIELSDEKRKKDLSTKLIFDPLTSIKSELSRSYPSNSRPPTTSTVRRMPPPSNTTEARVQRESSERARAVELIRRRKREKDREALGMANMTPSTVGGNEADERGYSDVYNRQETEDAHRRWDRNGARDRGGRNVNTNHREYRHRR
ncbi:hypothetical protein BU17DRAFT_54522 [Hysterangium stoloniferum]|nr:hypothetical protein BU17DRAFT_54522 [Hysterangium stoloniferum]